jgi:hypothetical protein
MTIECFRTPTRALRRGYPDGGLHEFSLNSPHRHGANPGTVAAETMIAEVELSPKVWWSKRRPRYNLALVVAGLGAFLAYVVVLRFRCADDPEVEVTIFTTAFQGLGYLLAMGIANLCYGLGAWAERLLGPDDVESFRITTFRLGLAFSVALPFSIPLLLAIFGCAH